MCSESHSSPVHAAVDGFPVLVSAGPPGVVPEAAPVALLLVADDLGNLAALPGQLGGPAQHGHAGGPRPDHTQSLVCHFWKLRYASSLYREKQGN